MVVTLVRFVRNAPADQSMPERSVRVVRLRGGFDANRESEGIHGEADQDRL